MFTNNKNTITYEIYCSNIKAFYFELDQINRNNLWNNEIVKRMELENTAGKKVITLAEIKRKLLKGKVGQFLERSK